MLGENVNWQWRRAVTSNIKKLHALTRMTDVQQRLPSRDVQQRLCFLLEIKFWNDHLPSTSATTTTSSWRPDPPNAVVEGCLHFMSCPMMPADVSFGREMCTIHWEILTSDVCQNVRLVLFFFAFLLLVAWGKHL